MGNSTFVVVPNLRVDVQHQVQPGVLLTASRKMSSYSWFHSRRFFVRLDLGHSFDDGHVTKDLSRVLKATSY